MTDESIFSKEHELAFMRALVTLNANRCHGRPGLVAEVEITQSPIHLSVLTCSALKSLVVPRVIDRFVLFFEMK